MPPLNRELHYVICGDVLRQFAHHSKTIAKIAARWRITPVQSSSMACGAKIAGEATDNLADVMTHSWRRDSVRLEGCNPISPSMTRQIQS
jgi:hypothetical protein